MKMRRFKRSTAFALGLAGAGINLVGGVLMACGFGAAGYTKMAALALYGAMLLVLALLEKGQDKRTLRTILLVLFFVLLASNLGLPLLDILEAAVLPLVLVLYRSRGDGPVMALLILFELFLAAVRTLSITPVLGTQPLRVWGVALAATAVVRGLALARLQRRAAAAAQSEGEPPPSSLR